MLSGKIMSGNSVQKKSLITPSSWREGHKVAETILNSMFEKKTETTKGKYYMFKKISCHW